MDLALPSRYVLPPDPILGEGGMGRVVLARDVVLDLPVAIKLVRPDLASDERFRRLFALEVRTSARFTHPHIVPLHDHGVTPDGTPFLGLAYADAGSFAGLRDEPPDWGELLRLVRQLLEALAHLHARDVLHRDLKPENVLLHTGADGGRHVWLADLGLAHAGTELARRRGRTEGTPGYMAPEQAMGHAREQGPWTDLFAVGVLLWEVTTGARPFPDDQSPLKAPLPPFAPRIAVPAALETVLANVLRAEPLARYDLAADLATELAALGPPQPHNGAAARIGTVAPSLVSGPTVDPLGETLDEEALSALLEDDTADRGTSWNRPYPRPIPERPPTEAATGATARASLPLFALRELPLVARDGLRQALWDHARAAAADRHGRVVILAGEAGSGRTRLVQALVRALEEGGHAEAVRLSYTREAGDTDGYAGAARALLRPWNETRASLESRLRRRLGRERGEIDDAVRAEASALARWCGLLEPDEEPAPLGLGLREVYRHLEARRWRGLSCLVLDDVQWATDEGDGLAIPEALLDRWADEDGGAPLLVLVSVRAEDLAADAVLRGRIDALVARGAHRIEVPRLDRAGTEALLAESITLEPELAARVAVRCEGNPLFARQLLLEWVERGWLVDRGGLRFGLREDVDADAVLPRDAGELFRERVASLAVASGSAQRFDDVVHLAALGGRAVPRALIEGFAGADLVAFVLACGLWTVAGEELSFDSGLLHQALAAQAARRPDALYLHRRLGRAYARVADGRDHAFDAGRHAVAAGDLTYGVPLLLRAAESAWTAGRAAVLEEASRMALDATADSTVGQHAGPALLWRARAHEARGEHAAAAELFEAARDALGADTEAGLEALVGIAWSRLRAGEIEAAEALFSDAVNRARQARSMRLECLAIAGKAWVEQQKRNFPGADILFARVLNRCTQTSDVRGAADALVGQAYVARRTGRFDEADELYGEAADAFREGGDPLGEARARLGLATSHRQRRHDDVVEDLLRDGLARAEELGTTALVMDARLGLAELARQRGDGERARRGYEGVEAWALRAGAFEAAITSALGLGLLALDAGDLDAAYEHVRRAAERLDRVPGHWLWATYRLVVAALLARRHDHTQTWQWLWSAQELGLADTVDRDTAGCLAAICEVAAERGWGNVVRLAGKLGAEQYRRLGDDEAVARIERRVAQALG